MRIAIVGVGSVGSALGQRFAEVGHQVLFGVREGKDVEDLLAACGGKARAGSVAALTGEAEIVVLAVPHEVAVEALEEADVDGKVVIDCCNPLIWDDGPVWDPPPEGSVTAQLSAAYPRARVVKAFATFGAAFHRDPLIAGESVDVHIAGDDEGARLAVAELARGAGFQPVDAGPERNAALLENLAMLWIHLAHVGGLGREFVFQIVRRG